jgi:dienelactone hydrolase
MNNRLMHLLLGVVLVCSLLASPEPASAWNVSPEKVTFVNDQGITLTGWLFKPSGSGPFSAVVMMHGCAGTYSYGNPSKGLSKHFREWGDRLVSAGYVGLMVDSFTPRGVSQNQCGKNQVSEVTDRPKDAYAALKYLASRSDMSAGKIGLLGWSNGGSSVMSTMDATNFNATNNFKVAISFYPGCGLDNAFSGLSKSTWKPYAPLAILHGSADTVVNVGHCTTRVSKAQAQGATSLTLTIFPNAHHSFDQAVKVEGKYTQADVDAKKAADNQTMGLFATYLR